MGAERFAVTCCVQAASEDLPTVRVCPNFPPLCLCIAALPPLPNVQACNSGPFAWALGSGKVLPVPGSTGTFSTKATAVGASADMTSFIAKNQWSIGYSDTGMDAGQAGCSSFGKEEVGGAES